MVRKTKKLGVQEIIKTLVDSEIPEIQSVAKQLAEWTKQLEEHSWKLQHYASEIESMAAAEAAEARDEIGLAELVKDLEKTLSQLRGAPGKIPALPEGNRKQLTEEKPEEREPAPVKSESLEAGTEKSERTLQAWETYTTPEGFVVRRAKHLY